MLQSIDIPFPRALPERVRWRMAGDHLVVRGERVPFDHLADPDSRRPEWFEHRIAVRIGVPGVRVLLISTPDGPHLLVTELPGAGREANGAGTWAGRP